MSRDPEAKSEEPAPGEEKGIFAGSPLDQWETRDNVLYKRESHRGGTTLKPISRTAPEMKVATNEQDGQEYWEIGFQTVRERYITVTVPRAKMATRGNRGAF